MNKTKQYIDQADKYGAHNYKPLPIVIETAEGAWVHDVEGNKYLDMLSAYSALNHGHRHPRIVKKAKEQLDKLTLTSRAFHSDQLSIFSEKITKIFGYDKVLPMNSGAEAVETALKLARKWGYTKKGVKNNEAEIIVCTDNFHGRTITIVSFSTENAYRDAFGPFTPGFKIVKYGDINELKNAFTKNTVAFLVEPIQGEAGIKIPPQGFLKEAKRLCVENNALLMADEIQTGLGRTGKLLCQDWEGVKADVVTIGKALGGGIVPISAVLATKEVMDVFVPGEHGSTFGGNPFACAIANEALDIIVEEKFADRACELGDYFLNKLKTINFDMIKEVRGRGLLIGLELKPEAGGARKYCELLKEEGILCKETHDHVIRFAPPLIISKNNINWAFEKIKKVLS